jgi:SAM-dependent methyltransferase
MAASSKWPKHRPVLTPEQDGVFEDWNREFSGFIKASKFNRISSFDHRFPLDSYAPHIRTLEIGAGAGTHLVWEQEGCYVALERSEQLARLIPHRDDLEVISGDCEARLPYADGTFDRVLAIHVLEHLYDLPSTLREVRRLLKPTGVFSIVIPCEGGALYSLGRRFTSKRIFERRYRMAYDWLIKYDHCNSAEEVVEELTAVFAITRRHYWPLRIPSIDLNLTVGLECRLLAA